MSWRDGPRAGPVTPGDRWLAGGLRFVVDPTQASRHDDVAVMTSGPDPDGLTVPSPVATAVVARDGSAVRLHAQADARPESVRSFLTGMVAVQVLATRGVPALHGAVVASADGSGAVAIVGPSGAGKSTLALALGRVMADDLCALHTDGEGWTVGASDGPLRLRADVVARLSVRDAPQLQPATTGDKFELTLPSPATARRRLIGLVVLGADGHAAVLANMVRPPASDSADLRRRGATVLAAADTVPVLSATGRVTVAEVIDQFPGLAPAVGEELLVAV